jgi:hypothetical protein
MKKLLTTSLVMLSVLFMVTSCNQEEEIFTPNENLIVVDKETADPCCNGWDCQNLDANAGVVSTGRAMPYYAGEIGWTRYVYPFKIQKYARNFCFDKDHRIYFTSSYFANPANHGNIRLRVVDGTPNCSGTPYADYLTAANGNPLGLAPGTPYVRVTIGQFCDSNVLLVAP